mmetsp:Transcript_81848/g.250094  ORF Transcript_81848/g.250094 Transcript_81848/m.250094 type:complete len:295 (-) Transcript_81848:474-1358(-)
MLASVIQMAHIVNEDLLEPLAHLFKENVARDVPCAQVELSPHQLHLRLEILALQLVLRRAGDAVLHADVRVLRQRQEGLACGLAEAAAQQVVPNQRVATDRAEAHAQALLANDMRVVATSQLSVLRKANGARVAGHHGALGDLGGVGPPSGRPPPLRVAFLELHEAVLGRPVHGAKARVIDRDLVLGQERLPARCAEIIEGALRYHMLHHVPHAVHIGRRLPASEAMIVLVRRLQPPAHLGVVRLPPALGRRLDQVLRRRGPEPPLVDGRVVLFRAIGCVDHGHALGGHLHGTR